MGEHFLSDLGKAALIVLAVYTLAGCYAVYTLRRNPHGLANKQGHVFDSLKALFFSQYSLGVGAVAGILALLVAESLSGTLTIGGFFMGLLYYVFSQRS